MGKLGKQRSVGSSIAHQKPPGADQIVVCLVSIFYTPGDSTEMLQENAARYYTRRNALCFGCRHKRDCHGIQERKAE